MLTLESSYKIHRYYGVYMTRRMITGHNQSSNSANIQAIKLIICKIYREKNPVIYYKTITQKYKIIPIDDHVRYIMNYDQLGIFQICDL